MFYCRKTNNRINKLHETALRLVYSDYESTFEDLLKKDGSFTVHHYNIQILAVELYKVYNNISQTIWGNCLQEIIMTIIYVQNLIFLFRKLGLY